MTDREKLDIERRMSYTKGKREGITAEREAWRERLLRVYADAETNNERGELFTLIIEEIKAGK